jgi:hypothetical protein
MLNGFQDVQKLGKVDMTDYMQAMGELNKNWQTLATELTYYSKRSFEDGVATFQKLATAKSLPEAVEIQTTYAKSAYENYMQQMTKIGAMYKNFAQGAFKPFERVVQGSR